MLSVIIPAYNEESSIAKTLEIVAGVFPEKEIIVINDASQDKTGAILEEFKSKIDGFPLLKEYRFVNKSINAGKGAAIRTALPLVKGNIVLIQDADLELDPREYVKLLEPFEKLNADIVFGSRCRREGIVTVHRLWHLLVNKILTGFSNIMSGLYITDMETGYKVFRREVILSFNLRSDRFGIEPEFAAKTAKAVKKNNLNFYEVAVSYHPRSRKQGKKINWWDGVKALFLIFYFNLFEDA